MKRVAPVEDGDPVLVPEFEPHAGRERRGQRRGEAPGVVLAFEEERERGRRDGRGSRLGPEADGPIARVTAVCLNLGRQVSGYVPLNDGHEADVPEAVGRPVGVVLAGVPVTELTAGKRHADRLDELETTLVGILVGDGGPGRENESRERAEGREGERVRGQAVVAVEVAEAGRLEPGEPARGRRPVPRDTDARHVRMIVDRRTNREQFLPARADGHVSGRPERVPKSDSPEALRAAVREAQRFDPRGDRQADGRNHGLHAETRVRSDAVRVLLAGGAKDVRADRAVPAREGIGEDRRQGLETSDAVWLIVAAKGRRDLVPWGRGALDSGQASPRFSAVRMPP